MRSATYMKITLKAESMPNKALQRRPCSAMLMITRNTAHGPAERRCWAPSPQSLKCEMVRTMNWVGSATRFCGARQRQRQAPHRRSTDNRLRQVGHRFGALPAVEPLGYGQTPVLPARSTQRSKRTAPRCEAGARASEGQGKSGAELVQSQRRRVRREAEGGKPRRRGDQPQRG
jgi:hypothetical protein